MSQNLFIGITVTGITVTAVSLFLLKKSGEKIVEQNGSTRYTKTPKGHSDKTPGQEQERLLLSKASKLWVDRVIPLSEASKIWVETKEDKNSGPRPSFEREAIDEFYTTYVEKRAYVTGSRKSLITRLLRLLDREGACPSVVRNKKQPDAENLYTDEVFAMLTEIPLWEHSLNVARHMVQRASQETIVPDVLIAALAHDIGKIPAYHDKGYSTGDHPIISASVLSGMSEFAQIPS